ncbi:MAG: AraC family transcriptional regulator [Atopobiaceae bacterium]|nr:AraC family transcriptional regulator [Atopobiaceae bacterium]
MPASQNTYQVFPATDYIDLVPYQYGREFCHPGHAFGPARRNHYLFHYVISGRGTLISQDEEGHETRNELHAGQGFMIFPQQINTYQADMDDPWVYTWVEFDGMRVRDTLDLIGLTPSYPVYTPSNEELRAQLEQEMLFLSTHSEAPVLQLIGHLYLFFDCLVRSSSRRGPSPSGKLQDIHVRTALEYVERHYREDITVADIARSTGLNPSYFGKVFKEATGRTPQQHLIGYRMNKATELLKLTSMSIAEVGAEVGYPNQLHFSRAFKGFCGLSPRDWRKSNSRLI